jgi:glucosamine-6-phosphate deaminase
MQHCWLFFMDEYCDEDGKAVTVEHPLSFQAQARARFLDLLSAELRPPEEQILFPDEDNVSLLAETIDTGGGIDVCYGGIGIHGHIAFNEPGPGVSVTGPRKVRLNDFTVTINALRAHVGGSLECFPREAYTLGMRQILESREICLYCRNGCEFDWANTVLRLALFGEPGDDYPVTHVRGCSDVITTDRQTLATPANLV